MDGSRLRLREFDALLLTALIWFLAKFLRYAFPPLFGTFRAQFGVSRTAVGTAFGAMMLVYALMQFPSGALADRLGAVRVVAAGAVVAAAGAFSLVVPAAPGDLGGLPTSVDGAFAALVSGMLLVGLGTGAHKTVAVRLLSRIYPARTGRALGVLDTFGAFGGVAAPAAVVAATGAGAVAVGWRGVFLAGAAAGVTLTVLFVVRVPRRVPDAAGGRTGEAAGAGPAAETGTETATRVEAGPDPEKPAGADRGETTGVTDGPGRGIRRYGAPFVRRRFSLFVAVTVLFSFGYNGVVAFLPLYLTESAGLGPAFAGLLYSALFAVSIVQMATGELSDRVGPLPVVGGTLALATAGLGLLLVGEGPVTLAVGVVAFGLGGHGYRPVRGSYLVSVIPEAVAGGTLGVVRTLIMAAGALSPAVVGTLSDAAGFDAGFAALAASMVGGLACTGVLLARPSPSAGR